MAISIISLDQAGWTDLAHLLEVNQDNHLLTSKLIDQLRALGALTIVVEDEYIDRDFSEAFSAYYSKLFKRHSKLCKRIHVFARDLEPEVNSATVSALARSLEACNSDYLGFIVLRPVHQAPIASALITPPPVPVGHEQHLLVKARYDVHLLGAELSVYAHPMTQQDQRIGACAQASIWSASRHLHARHKGPWVSMVGITEAAMAHEAPIVKWDGFCPPFVRA